jgi:cytochrome c-type biogenesis protein CcmF
MGVAPFARWKEASPAEIARAVRWALAPAIIVAIALPLVYGSWSALTALGLLLATWIVCTAILNFVERVQHTRAGRSFLSTALKQPRHFFGMHLAHIGIAVFVVGVTMVSSFQEEKDVKMAPGESVDVAGYHFTFNGVRAVEGPNYTAAQGDFDLAVDGKFQRKMNPEKRNYASSGMPMTEAAIDAGFLRDAYVSLGEPIDRDKPEGEWAVRVYYKPFVDWIWGGCVLMALGGLLALLDRRYRVKSRAAAAVTTPAGSQQA